MKEAVKQQLFESIERLRIYLSNPKRENNYLQEEFALRERVVRSEDTAHAIFEKNGGKWALFFFVYHVGQWYNFPPTCGHLVGMKGLDDTYQYVEQHNTNIGTTQNEC